MQQPHMMGSLQSNANGPTQTNYISQAYESSSTAMGTVGAYPGSINSSGNYGSSQQYQSNQGNFGQYGNQHQSFSGSMGNMGGMHPGMSHPSGVGVEMGFQHE